LNHILLKYKCKHSFSHNTNLLFFCYNKLIRPNMYIGVQHEVIIKR